MNIYDYLARLLVPLPRGRSSLQRHRTPGGGLALGCLSCAATSRSGVEQALLSLVHEQVLSRHARAAAVEQVLCSGELVSTSQTTDTTAAK